MYIPSLIEASGWLNYYCKSFDVFTKKGKFKRRYTAYLYLSEYTGKLPGNDRISVMAGTVEDKNSVWYDETKTNLDPTMGAGNIVIAMLYRRIVQCGQDPVVALSNVYGVELDSKTLTYARERIYKFMMAVEKKSGAKWSEDDWKKIHDIIYCKNPFTNSEHPNFVCSDIFEWNIEKWKPESECNGGFDEFFS